MLASTPFFKAGACSRRAAWLLCVVAVAPPLRVPVVALRVDRAGAGAGADVGVASVCC